MFYLITHLRVVKKRYNLLLMNEDNPLTSSWKIYPIARDRTGIKDIEDRLYPNCLTECHILIYTVWKYHIYLILTCTFFDIIVRASSVRCHFIFKEIWRIFKDINGITRGIIRQYNHWIFYLINHLRIILKKKDVVHG